MAPLALLPFLLAMVSPTKPSLSGPLLDDRAVTIHSAVDVAARRRALIRYIWGGSGLPTKKVPSSVKEDVPSPVRGLTNLRGVVRLDVALDLGNSGLAYLFAPVTDAHRLVVLHHGHACTFDDGPGSGSADYGMQGTLNGLLARGCTVLTVFMPHQRPDDCTGGHDKMFSLSTEGSPMKFFLEPVAVCVNYALAGDRRFRDVTMIGLSGGGWTTTLYAAIDSRVKLSIPVAGSLPLYLRWGGSVGDEEQFVESFYRIAGYLDLYLLGSAGKGRRQIQILNRNDDCCFGRAQHDAALAGMPYEEAVREYETRVFAALHESGSGAFEVKIDTKAPGHMISEFALESIILPALTAPRK